jgi:hypothetical protein
MKNLVENNNKEVARLTIIRKDQECHNCHQMISKGSKVICKAWIKGKTVNRLYYCLECSEIKSE